MVKAKEEPTKEQYEQLISLLQEQNDWQKKTIEVQNQQIEILQELLNRANKKLEEQISQNKYVSGGYYR